MADQTGKTILLEIDLNVAQAATSIGQLKALQADLNKQFQAAQIGSDTYKQLQVQTGLVSNSLKSLQTDTKNTTASLGVQSGSLRDLQAQYNTLSNALRNAAPNSKVLGMSFADATTKTAGLKTQIADFEAKINNFTPNVGNYGKSLKDAALQSGVLGQYSGQLASIQGLLQKGFGNAAVGANGLKVAMLAIPIFALIAGIAILISYFSKNDDASDKMKGSLAAAGVVLDVFIDSVISLGKFLLNTRAQFDLLSDFIQHPIDTVKKLSAEFVDQAQKTATLAKEMYNLQAEYREIEDATDALTVATAKGNQQVTNLILQSKNVTKSYQERSDALKQASAIEVETSNQTIALAQRKLDAIKAENAANAAAGKIQSDDEARKKQYDAEVELINLQTESLNLQEKIANRADALEQAHTAKVQAEIDKRKKAQQDYLTQQYELLQASENKEESIIQIQLKDTAASYKDKLALLQKYAIDQQTVEMENRKLLLSNTDLTETQRKTIITNSETKILAINQQYVDSKKTMDQQILANENANANAILALQDSRIKREIQTEKNMLGNYKLNINTRIGLLNSIAAQEIQIEKNRAAMILKNDQLSEAARQQVIEESEAKIVEINQQASNEIQQAKLKEAAIASQVELQKIGYVSKSIGAIGSLFQQGSATYKAFATAQAMINTYSAATAALTAPPIGLGPVAGIPLAAVTVVEGLANVAQINGIKFAHGGIAHGKKEGVIGGKPHSEGGTKFYGSDGSFFEAERGELITVVNKFDTMRLKSLSRENSVHGKPFFESGGIVGKTYLADGGFAASAASIPVHQQQQQIQQQNQLITDTVRMLQAVPPPIVSVQDVMSASNARQRVRVLANITSK